MIQTIASLGFTEADFVSMPVRAFLDSDGSGATAKTSLRKPVSMPVRAFLDSDRNRGARADTNFHPFQCPSGHFLIQTRKDASH